MVLVASTVAFAERPKKVVKARATVGTRLCQFDEDVFIFDYSEVLIFILAPSQNEFAIP
jgi:hypothetical protein